MENLIGQSIGRYHILEQLGEGGMAIVYKAYDTRLECDVAVKFIRTEKLNGENAEKVLKRFKTEAQKTAALMHPNIIPVIDYGDYEGMPYLVMKYLPGGTLKKVLDHRLKNHAGPFPYQQAAALLAPIARALELAHQNGIVHRDIKPSNILLTQNGQPMLTDFGVAKIIEADVTMDETGLGVGVGTPQYMAPEQWEGEAIDARADVYSLGVVFYEMITGRVPFKADTVAAILVKVMRDPLPDPNKFVKDIPPKVEHILYKALARNPAGRYKSITQFAVDLESLVNDPIDTRSRSRLLPLVGGTVAVVIATALLIVFFAGAKKNPDRDDQIPLTQTQLQINLKPTPSPTSAPTGVPTQTTSTTSTPGAPSPTPTLAQNFLFENTNPNLNPTLEALNKLIGNLPKSSQQLIFNQDFETNKSDGFYPNTGDWVVVADETGNIVFRGDSWPSSNYSNVSFGPYFADGTIEYSFRIVKINPENDASGYVSCLFRQLAVWNPQYVFGYFSKDSYLSFNFENYQKDIWKDVSGTHFETGDGWHSVQLVIIGDHFDAYIDGRGILSGSDSTKQSGKLGFEIGPDTIVEFDNIKVWASQ